jgi:hypothetical protein
VSNPILNDFEKPEKDYNDVLKLLNIGVRAKE